VIFINFEHLLFLVNILFLCVASSLTIIFIVSSSNSSFEQSALIESSFFFLFVSYHKNSSTKDLLLNPGNFNQDHLSYLKMKASYLNCSVRDAMDITNYHFEYL